MKPAFIDHPVFRQDAWNRLHPLAYSRQRAVRDLVRSLDWLDDDAALVPDLPGKAVLTRLHDPNYVDALEAAVASGQVSSEDRERYGFGTMENPIFPGLFDRARATVGGAMLAAKVALDGRVAFHPAGGTHHGQPDRASGFCYFNDPAFAVLALLDAGLTRVLYLDIDAHHGDGVFAAYASDARVACASLHEVERWPYTGAEDEQDARTLNVPLPRRINDDEFLALFDKVVMPFARRFDPQAVVVTCGADGLAGDPLSHMELSNHTLWRATQDACELAPAAVVLGGGGYNPWTTVRCWAGLWGALCGFDMPNTLPPAAQALLAGFESDLVDEDEVEPHWLAALVDPSSPGAVRPEVGQLIARLRQVHSL